MDNELTTQEADALASLLRQIKDREDEDATTPITLTVERAQSLWGLIRRKIGGPMP